MLSFVMYIAFAYGKGKKEDEARSILCFQYFDDCLSKNELHKVACITKCLLFIRFVVGK